MASRELPFGERSRVYRFLAHLHLFRQLLTMFPDEASWGEAYLSFDLEVHRDVAALERYFESVVNFGLGIEQAVLVHCGIPEARDWSGDNLEAALVEQGVLTNTMRIVAQRLRRSRNRVQHAYELLDARVLWMAANDLNENADDWFQALSARLVSLGYAVPAFDPPEPSAEPQVEPDLGAGEHGAGAG